MVRSSCWWTAEFYFSGGRRKSQSIYHYLKRRPTSGMSFEWWSHPTMRSVKGTRKSDKSKPLWLEEMEAMDDEPGLKYAIFQEGRMLQPSEPLGLFTYVQKVRILLCKGSGNTHIDGLVLLVSLPRSLSDSLVKTNMDHWCFCPSRITADSINELADMMEDWSYPSC